MAEAIDKYLEEESAKLRQCKSTLGARLSWFRVEIGDLLLSQLTPAVLSECKRKILNSPNSQGKRRTGPTANRYMSAISSVLNFATKEWMWISQNPASSIRRERESIGRKRFLSDDERVKLLELCSLSGHPYIKQIVLLALSTGGRKAEILNLRWCEVDLVKGNIAFSKTKSGVPRVVPLCGLALDELRQYGRVRRIDTQLLFPNKSGDSPVDIRRVWERLREAALLEDFRFHDLRHSAASYFAMSGATPNEIAEILGHSTLQMVKRYVHFSEQHSRSVVERMNEKMFGN